MTAIVVALGLVNAVLAILVIGLLQSNAQVLRALHDEGVHLGHDRDRRSPSRATTVGPSQTAPGIAKPRGTGSLGAAVDVSGSLPGGGGARIAVVGVPHATLLAFLSSTCGTCQAFWEEFDQQGTPSLPGEDTRLVIVTQDPEHEQEAAILELAPPSVTTVMSTAAWEDHDVPVAPYFLLVDGPSGQVIGEGSGTTWPQVADLLSKALADTGFAPDGGRTRRELFRGGADRSARIDRTLAEAGIEPGHPSLYPEVLDPEVEV